MRYLQPISLLILVAGIALFVSGWLFDLGALVTVIGMMLVVAAVVKMITVRIWHGFFEGDSAVRE
jgi:uncharacterized membrane protein